MTINSTHKKIETLQLLRGGAFLLIFLSHCTVINGFYSRLGVTVFFIMSGFFSAYKYGIVDHFPGGAYSVAYAFKRIKKQYLLHLICLLFAAAGYLYSIRDILSADITRNVLIYGLEMLTNVLLINDWLPEIGRLKVVFAEYNIVTWFLSALFLFYFFTPLIIWIEQRFSRKKRHIILRILIVCLIITFENICFYQITHDGWYVYQNPLSRIGDYYVGIILAGITAETIYDQDERQKSVIFLIASLVGIVGLLIMGNCALDEPIMWIKDSGFYFTIPVVGLIFSLYKLDTGDVFTFWPLRILRYIGEISPFAFLIHVPVINFIHAILKRVQPEVNMNIYLWGGYP